MYPVDLMKVHLGLVARSHKVANQASSHRHECKS
jgi:hypothetical protein